MSAQVTVHCQSSPEAGPLRLLLYYPHGFSIHTWAALAAAGERPESSHWGMHQAAELGFTVVSSLDGGSDRLHSLISRLTHRLLRFDLYHFWRNRRLLADADIVWAMSERELIPAVLGIWLRHGGRARPVLCGDAVWLADEWPGYSRLRRWCLRRLLARVDALLITTEGGADHVRKLLPGVPVYAYRFGVPIAAFAHVRAGARTRLPGEVRPARVLAPGNDLRRDWDTITAALAGDARFEVTLLSRREHVRTYAARGTNLHFIPAGKLRGLLEWYTWADIMVVASLSNVHGAGASMLLEATAAGIPIVCTRTGYLDEYLPDDCVRYVPPGDPAALRDAVAALAAAPDEAAAQAMRAREALSRLKLDSRAAAARRCRIMTDVAARRLLRPVSDAAEAGVGRQHVAGG